ncbi:hypothetical protein DO021_03770 [Desulfobacter hydrogenophilus]|uniref:Uncharacterized protein n=1 Tax=Desulfobacter hydrogenophilus TaxID=2291 RepID=A0A328FGV0_9BACT|nr:hypothetical protein DO021_03770 [Desulfobacter hydrogenophilus]
MKGFGAFRTLSSEQLLKPLRILFSGAFLLAVMARGGSRHLLQPKPLCMINYLNASKGTFPVRKFFFQALLADRVVEQTSHVNVDVFTDT